MDNWRIDEHPGRVQPFTVWNWTERKGWEVVRFEASRERAAGYAAKAAYESAQKDNSRVGS